MYKSTKPQNVKTDEDLKEKTIDFVIDETITGADTNNRTQFYTDFSPVNKVTKLRVLALHFSETNIYKTKKCTFDGNIKNKYQFK